MGPFRFWCVLGKGHVWLRQTFGVLSMACWKFGCWVASSSEGLFLPPIYRPFTVMLGMVYGNGLPRLTTSIAKLQKIILSVLAFHYPQLYPQLSNWKSFCFASRILPFSSISVLHCRQRSIQSFRGASKTSAGAKDPALISLGFHRCSYRFNGTLKGFLSGFILDFIGLL